MPDFSQNFNRYSYCLNNPLIYTDPDGEIIIETLVILGAYLGGAAANKNKNSGAWGWNPLKWEPNLKTLGGVIGGAALGYLGGSAVQGLFAGTTTLNIGLGNGFLAGGVELNLSGAGAIIEGLGYSTAAGGGLWLTSNMLSGKENSGSYSDMTMVDNARAENEGCQAWYSIYNWPGLGSSAHTMDAIYAGDYLSATGHFLTCAAEVFTFGYASTMSFGSKATNVTARGTHQFKWLRGTGGETNGFTISQGSGYGARPRFDFHKLSNTYNSRVTSRMTIPEWLDGKKLPHWHRGKGNNLRYHRPWEIGPDGKRRW